ncbi:thymocyte nuclear protein 1-like [Hibiscus syriacus]|uniref:Phytosulfokine n=1 Tax=Hibiscus syriacus TaxID=106335 RepID=A0A6A3A611_HIBSY|nr:thymocyte nuclear protein 1-like [Hibiscus syriacus]
MCSKVSFFCMIMFLFFFILSSFVVARPLPASSVQHANQQLDDIGEENDQKVELEDSCVGIVEEECLMRRTLAAQTDYIYTQKTKP